MEDRRNSEIPPKIKGSTSANVRFFASRLTRKKSIDPNDVLDTDLRRCLSTADITLLALGHMVGSGVYVLTATVAKEMAGPAIILSFIFSGFASFLSALSYSELGVRYPNCGSAYSYTYLALGEVWAFIVGWSMALENSIAAAATARSCSGYIDSLMGGVIRNITDTYFGPIDSELTSDHLDFLAAGIVILFVFFLSFGVRVTSYLTNVFAVLNIVIIVLIIGVGAYFSNTKNWTNPDTGGFMPYGFSGVLAASASCFYAYVGFDAISATGEEAKNPQKSIPRAMMISMSIATVCYVGVATVLTLMVNYRDISDYSGLPEALASHGSYWSKIVVVIGATSGMATAIVGSLYTLTRVIYVMADDGLLFTFCAKVSVRTKTPLRAMYVFSCLSAALALVLDLRTLVEVMSIGTLMAYIVVSASVVILRYRPRLPAVTSDALELCTINENSVPSALNSFPPDYAGSFKDRFKNLKNYVKLCPGKLVTYCIASYCTASLFLCSFVKLSYSSIAVGAWWAILITIILALWVIASFGIILLHQQSTFSLRYKVPLVPLIPALSIMVNITLAVNLHTSTWLRMLFWMSAGLSMYLSYGVEHSKMDVIETADPPRPITWGSSDTQAAFDARRKAAAAKRTKPPVVTTLSREFLFKNVDPIP